ncbi:DUF6912 family protein [Georgenia sp. Z1491]|uniref:DUF6912 family protein n=1 Tax=Georgenia sp. Z1491 TaxID=3416707 RepID=UPI003CF595F8
MRIYLPATPAELAATPGAVHAHAVTRDLAAAVPDEDEEGLELVAFLAAADDSVRRRSELDAPGAARRVVVSADVADGAAIPVPGGLPSLVRLEAPVGWDAVAAIHVDEASVQVDVEAAAAGDDEVFERVAELDLMWFDPSERATILEG